MLIKKDSSCLQTLSGQAIMNCGDHSHATGRVQPTKLS